MLKTLKKQFEIQKQNGIFIMVFTLGMFLLGKVLFHMIAYFDGELESWFPMGTLMACIMAAMFVVISLLTLRSYFNMEISMGCTRARFFVTYYMVYFVFSVISLAWILLLCKIENIWNSMLYPELPCDLDFFPYLLKWGLPAAVVVVLLGGFGGALLMRYGKWAGWTMWAIWMIVCVGFPRLEEASENTPESLPGRLGTSLGEAVLSVPTEVWGILAAVICLGSLAGAWIILRKQQVTA